MKTPRSIIVVLAAASLFSLPLAGFAASSGPVSGAAPHTRLAQRYGTAIRFLDFDHTRGYGGRTHIRGQVAVPSLGGAVAGLKVKLYRQFNGSSHWARVSTDYTSHTGHPRFVFTVASRANAGYRVVYSGNKRLRPSRNTTGVAVYRHFDATIENGSGRFHGRISPRYMHRTVYLDKRRCGTCGWHRVTSEHSSRRGTFSFKTNAPRKGKFYWRAATPATKQYIRSYSPVFTTRLG